MTNLVTETPPKVKSAATKKVGNIAPVCMIQVWKNGCTCHLFHPILGKPQGFRWGSLTNKQTNNTGFKQSSLQESKFIVTGIQGRGLQTTAGCTMVEVTWKMCTHLQQHLDMLLSKSFEVRPWLLVFSVELIQVDWLHVAQGRQV